MERGVIRRLRVRGALFRRASDLGVARPASRRLRSPSNRR